MSYELKRLAPRHFKIFELSLAGLTNREIGAALELTPEAIHNVLNCPLGQAELARRKRALEEEGEEAHKFQVLEAKKMVAEASLEAASTMRELLSSQDDTVKFRSSKALLDMAFGKNEERGNISVTIVPQDKMSVLVTALQESNSGRKQVQVRVSDPLPAPAPV